MTLSGHTGETAEYLSVNRRVVIDLTCYPEWQHVDDWSGQKLPKWKMDLYVGKCESHQISPFIVRSWQSNYNNRKLHGNPWAVISVSFIFCMTLTVCIGMILCHLQPIVLELVTKKWLERGGYRGVWLQSTALEICLLQATEFQKLPDYSLQFCFFVLYSLQAKILLNSTVYRLKIRSITVYGISITPPR